MTWGYLVCGHLPETRKKKEPIIPVDYPSLCRPSGTFFCALLAPDNHPLKVGSTRGRGGGEPGWEGEFLWVAAPGPTPPPPRGSGRQTPQTLCCRSKVFCLVCLYILVGSPH